MNILLFNQFVILMHFQVHVQCSITDSTGSKRLIVLTRAHTIYVKRWFSTWGISPQAFSANESWRILSLCTYCNRWGGGHIPWYWRWSHWCWLSAQNGVGKQFNYCVVYQNGGYNGYLLHLVKWVVILWMMQPSRVISLILNVYHHHPPPIRWNLMCKW